MKELIRKIKHSHFPLEFICQWLSMTGRKLLSFHRGKVKQQSSTLDCHMMYSRTPVVYRYVRIQHNHSAAFGFVASALSLEPILIHCNSDLSYSLHKRLVTWSPVSPFEPGIPALPCKTKIGNNISNQLRLHHCCCFFPQKLWQKPPHAGLGNTSGLCAFFARCRPMALKYT